MTCIQNSKKFVGAFALGLILLTTSCSKVEWAVRWADTFVAYKINDQFEFEGDTKKTVKSESTLLIKTLQKKEFPKIAQLLQKGSQEFSQLDFNSETVVHQWVTSQMDRADGFLDSLPTDLEPFVLKIASLVGKDNWQAFQKNFEKDNNRLSKEKPKCFQKLKSELEDWLGSLHPSQREAIERYCGTREDSPAKRAQNRQHMIEVFKSWLGPHEGEFNSQKFQTAAAKWLKNYRSLQADESKEQWKVSRQVLIKSFTEILMSSSDAQRKLFLQNLEDRIQSLQRLSR